MDPSAPIAVTYNVQQLAFEGCVRGPSILPKSLPWNVLTDSSLLVQKLHPLLCPPR
jgi:hypothetical protein